MFSRGTRLAPSGLVAAPFDSLAKEILDLLLHEVGVVETEVEVAALPSQRVDLLFVPDPSRDADRRTLGLLGRMTDEACLFEAFHDAPSTADVVACLRKLLNHRHARTLLQRATAERAWLLCAGRPDGAIRDLEARAIPGAPIGFYSLPSPLPLTIVVLSELEHTDETLPLRLMGAGATLQAALRGLRDRYGLVPRGRKLYAAVIQSFLTAHRRGAILTEELMLDLTEAEEYMRTWHAEGHAEGRVEGRVEGQQETLRALLPALLLLTERTLGRPPTDAERDALQQRLDVDGPAAVGDALATRDAASLTTWLSAR